MNSETINEFADERVAAAFTALNLYAGSPVDPSGRMIHVAHYEGGEPARWVVVAHGFQGLGRTLLEALRRTIERIAEAQRQRLANLEENAADARAKVRVLERGFATPTGGDPNAFARAVAGEWSEDARETPWNDPR